MSTMDRLPEPLGTVVLGPSDHLIINLPAYTSPHAVHTFQDRLRVTRPELADRVTFVAGAEGFAVVRGRAPAAERTQSPRRRAGSRRTKRAAR